MKNFAHNKQAKQMMNLLPAYWSKQISVDSFITINRCVETLGSLETVH